MEAKDGPRPVPGAEPKQASAERVIQVPLSKLVRVEYVRLAIVESIEPATRVAVFATRLANLHVCRMLAEGREEADLFCGRSLRHFLRECFRTICPAKLDQPGTDSPADLAATFTIFRKVLQPVTLKKSERRYFESVMLTCLAEQIEVAATTALRVNIFRRARSCVLATVHTVVQSEHAGEAAEALRAVVNAEIYRRLGGGRKKKEAFEGVDHLLAEFCQKLETRLQKRLGDSVPATPLSDDEMRSLRSFLEDLVQVLPEELHAKKRYVLLPRRSRRAHAVPNSCLNPLLSIV